MGVRLQQLLEDAERLGISLSGVAQVKLFGSALTTQESLYFQSDCQNSPNDLRKLLTAVSKKLSEAPKSSTKSSELRVKSESVICWKCNKEGHTKKECKEVTQSVKLGGKQENFAVELKERKSRIVNDDSAGDLWD